jgi:hypothetical protein
MAVQIWLRRLIYKTETIVVHMCVSSCMDLYSITLESLSDIGEAV